MTQIAGVALALIAGVLLLLGIVSLVGWLARC
jgi:hypothetical protein